jgi:hypothetical protein
LLNSQTFRQIALGPPLFAVRGEYNQYVFHFHPVKYFTRRQNSLPERIFPAMFGDISWTLAGKTMYLIYSIS